MIEFRLHSKTSNSKKIMPTNARALHWVFKIGSRTKTMDFYFNILNMKILRHEEFEEGCDVNFFIFFNLFKS